MPILFASLGGCWVVAAGFFAVGTFVGVLFGDKPKSFILRLPFAIFCYIITAMVLWGFGDFVFGRTLLFDKIVFNH